MLGNALREIVIDTETTGLDLASGHRILEVACLELINCIPTGQVFQRYVNPEREVTIDAYQVHGLSIEFLAQQPKFADIADEMITFVGQSRVVIHNAEFDLAFLNAELGRAGRPGLEVVEVIDTVALAKQVFPGAQVNLDALCRRFKIDCSARRYHGALLDCQLLAEVYIELCGGRQPGLDLAASTRVCIPHQPSARPRREARLHQPSEEELMAHQAIIKKLNAPIWGC